MIQGTLLSVDKISYRIYLRRGLRSGTKDFATGQNVYNEDCTKVRLIPTPVRFIRSQEYQKKFA